jgi:putative hydrolase of the HAD superfamily
MDRTPIPPQIRAIFFDAVDTLIKPDPSVVEVYRETGLAHGCRIEPEAMVRRFREAFQFEEKSDAASGWAVSENREHERWRSIVSHVFDRCPAVDRIFADLWHHFARAESWRVAEGTSEVLPELAKRGYGLGLASNFDRRLHSIADNLPELAPLRLRAISSEIGWRKPSRQFFEALVRSADCEAGQVLLVGDRLDTDYDGAIAAGLEAILLDPDAKAPDDIRRIGQLTDLLA